MRRDGSELRRQSLVVVGVYLGGRSINAASAPVSVAHAERDLVRDRAIGLGLGIRLGLGLGIGLGTRTRGSSSWPYPEPYGLKPAPYLTLTASSPLYP